MTWSLSIVYFLEIEIRCVILFDIVLLYNLIHQFNHGRHHRIEYRGRLRIYLAWNVTDRCGLSSWVGGSNDTMSRIYNTMSRKNDTMSRKNDTMSSEKGTLSRINDTMSKHLLYDVKNGYQGIFNFIIHCWEDITMLVRFSVPRIGCIKF
jgi:hypothetical protein